MFNKKDMRFNVCLTNDIIEETKELGVEQEERIRHSAIPDSQGLKPASAFHYRLPDAGTGGPP